VATVEFDRVEKVFADGTRAVDDLSLSVHDGEFMVFVGPSGCGKTTALRMAAGLEDISAGEIRIGGNVVNDLPARRRDVAMVFQSYALYPHMDVRKNMEFGLHARKLPKQEVRERVESAARILGLTELLHRRPSQLSGGQRQRVAMGRAIVREPHAFLMDEPLSNLDAKLRVQMRAEISRLQRELGATTIYVTHDQVEAMTMGDRVAVLRSGRLQQCDVPQQIYNAPANLFVASFIGSPPMNLVEATVAVDGPNVTCRVGRVDLDVGPADPLRSYAGRKVALGCRPEHFERARGNELLCLPARVVLTEALGPSLLVHAEVEGRALARDDVLEGLVDADPAASNRLREGEGAVTMIASFAADDPARTGDVVDLAVDGRRLHFFDLESGAAIPR
jgi:multiple sugar transport system ATP-binding protein